LELLGLPFWDGVMPARLPPVVSERKVRLFLVACMRREDLRRGRGSREADREQQKAEAATGAVSTTTGTSVGMMTAVYGRLAGARDQCAWLRCIFGSPFRAPAPLDPAVLAYNGGVARRLAECIYDGRRFEDLPVLADLLEEAGLTDAALLGHLRGPGPHALGCHALDAVLGKS
jgi:hypothetical protein